jgi:hypothetical protein
MQIRHAANCPAAVLYGLASPTPPARAALDRARLQDLIDLLDRFDLSSDCADTSGLSTELRAFCAALS